MTQPVIMCNVGGSPEYRGSDVKWRLLLGENLPLESASIWVAHYRNKYPKQTFKLILDAPTVSPWDETYVYLQD